MGDLSAHFSRYEFECKGHGRYGHRPHATIVAPLLVQHLEALRARVGRPLRIVSGHRCVWWNNRVSGAGGSRHIVGDGADLEYGYATLADAEAVHFTGIGTKGPYAVHVDTRGYVARWKY